MGNARIGGNSNRLSCHATLTCPKRKSIRKKHECGSLHTNCYGGEENLFSSAHLPEAQERERERERERDVASTGILRWCVGWHININMRLQHRGNQDDRFKESGGTSPRLSEPELNFENIFKTAS
jgi:hypothetical protein